MNKFHYIKYAVCVQPEAGSFMQVVLIYRAERRYFSL
jgi:hypothetical protein